jgi:hypothetical protein
MFEPFPSDPSGQKLCEVFGTYRWMTIEGDTDDSTKPNWRTVENYPLRPRSLWSRWQDAGQLVGVRFGHTTRYALLDIDAGSPYLNLTQLDNIRSALETIGLVRTIPTRSSWSGGLHLYIPLPDEFPTFDIAATIRYCLEAQGLELGEGKLECFPNTKSFGKWWVGQFTEYHAHRLPLQPGSGSVLLDDDLQPIGADLQRFFWSWEFAAMGQDATALTEALKHGRDLHRKRPKLRTHPVEQWRLDLESEISEGWTDHGQTNYLLKAIACYGRVFERLEGQELVDYVRQIALNRPGFHQWCRHQAELDRKAATWARAAEKYYWPLGSEPRRESSDFNPNDEKSKDAQQRIRDAVIHLASSGHLPDCITERVMAICKLAHTSLKTLYKYLWLWHPEHIQKGCVIDQPAKDSADFSPSASPPLERLEALPSVVLHTPPQIMKGVFEDSPPEKNYPWGERGSQRGEGGYPQPEMG